MKQLWIFLGLISVASAQGVIDPRGARPVEHGTRSEKCATQKEWPFCTSDEWGPKCPSGCRIQGLMDKYDHTLLKKVEKIRGLLDQNTVKHRSTDEVSKQTYDYLKEKLTTDAGNDNNYYDLAQSLRRRITEMKIKIDKQLRLLAALKDRVKDQVIEMQRLEVDIDIKLRSCKGSCSGYAEYQVDQESYVALDKQIDQLDSRSDQQVETVGTLYVMKSRVLKEELVPSIYKSGITGATAEAQKTEDVFPDVNTLELILEEEGSSSSPATVSKDPEVCLRLKQKNQVGRQSFTRSRWNKKQQCRVKPDPGLCSDDDWVSKCPSGCRLQGLIKKMENEAERKLWTVCKTGQMHEDAAEKSMKMMTHVYDSNRRVIVARYVSELKFAEHAEELAKNLTSLRKRSSRLSQQLKDLLRNVQKQVDDLYRTEVDIDMKLRTCRGSCQSALQFSVDHDSYHLFHNDMDQMDKTLNQRNKAVTPPEDIPLIRLQPVDIVPAPSVEYKTIPTVQKELLNLFEDVAPNHLLLDEPLKDSTDGQVLDLAELEWNEI